MSMGSILTRLTQAIGVSDTDTTDALRRTIQARYYDYCQLVDWQVLRRRTTLTFTGSETQGQLLPSDAIGVLAVQRETAGSEKMYFPADESMRYTREGKSRWFYENDDITPTVTRDAIGINNGATSWSGTMSGAADGEYFQIEDWPGFLKITDAASKTFSPGYWGPKITGKTVVVRPPGTKRLMVVDHSGDTDSGEIAVYYWAFPEPIWQDWQDHIFPTDEPLYLSCLLENLLPNRKRRDEWQTYQLLLDNNRGSGALPEMIAGNPKFIAPYIPHGKTGRPLSFGRNRQSLRTRRVSTG